MEIATFGAGCFWGIEDAFRKIRGVVSTRVGYAGGHTAGPTYKMVCTDKTGHAEVVEVSFDPALVSYSQLLDAFWKIHNPTTPNRQGPDVGSQYRSVIFYHGSSQQEAAIKSRDDVQKRFDDKIITEIVPAAPFYEAEEYHQKYHEKHGGDCSL